MSTTTTKLNLVKPEYSDVADIAVINSNMDKIDTAVGNLNTAVGMPYSNASSISSRVGTLESSVETKVAKAGDTMTGNITMKNTSADRDGTIPTSDTTVRQIVIHDKDDESVGWFGSIIRKTSGRVDTGLIAYNEHSGEPISNALYAMVERDGTRSYYVSDATAFRSAISAAASSHTHSAVTTSAAGFMSAADKTKLNGIATGAQVNTITGVKGGEESSYRTGNVNITASNIGTWSSTSSRTANTVLAAPNGSNGVGSFRKLVAADIPSLAASKITSGAFDADRIPALAASKITSGTFSADRIPALAASKITSGTFGVDRIPGLAASKITSGTLSADRIPALATSKVSGLGTYYSADSGSISVPDATYKAMCSITIPAGRYVLHGNVGYGGSGGGKRWAVINSGNDQPTKYHEDLFGEGQIVDGNAACSVCAIFIVSASSKFVLWAWQQSGSAKPARGYIQAVRIS